jgi:hypothetical protein
VKVLLTLHDLSQHGGVQTWTYEMARVLQARGHSVDVMCIKDGIFMDRLATVVDRVFVNSWPGADQDLVLACHRTPMEALNHYGHNGFKVYTQHGPFHPAEQYPGGADAVVAVSEEVKLHLAGKGHPATVIRNGIDLKRHIDFTFSHFRDYDVLSLCKGRRGRDMVNMAARKLGWKIQRIHYEDNPEDELQDAMNNARIVVGYGRTALEAAACGARVFVFDARGSDEPRADGWVTKATVGMFARHNFSGRTALRFYNQEQFEMDLGLVPEREETNIRSWLDREVNVEAKVTQYLSLLPTQSPTHSPDPTAEYEEETWPRRT